jgi:hypothetical protein
LVLTADVMTVGGPPECLRGRGDAWRDVLATNAARVTVNWRFATAGMAIADGDEVALVPERDGA